MVLSDGSSFKNPAHPDEESSCSDDDDDDDDDDDGDDGGFLEQFKSVAIFNLLDENSNGTISREELATGLSGVDNLTEEHKDLIRDAFRHAPSLSLSLPVCPETNM